MTCDILCSDQLLIQENACVSVCGTGYVRSQESNACVKFCKNGYVNENDVCVAVSVCDED